MTFTLRVLRSGSRWHASASGVGVLVLIALALLVPRWLRSAPLSASEAERLIAAYRVAQVATASVERGETDLRRRQQEVERARAVRIEAVEVRTSIFSAFRISQSYVARLVAVDGTRRVTEYYCFPGGVLTGPCSARHWRLAW